MLSRMLLMASASVALSGCAAFGPGFVLNTPKISVQAALENIAQGFKNAKMIEEGTTMGVYACRVEIHFNISAEATKGGGANASLTLSPATPPAPSVSISGNEKVSSQAKRGNTIDILFTSPACVPKDTAGYVIAGKVGSHTSAGNGSSSSGAHGTQPGTHKKASKSSSSGGTSVGDYTHLVNGGAATPFVHTVNGLNLESYQSHKAQPPPK